MSSSDSCRRYSRRKILQFVGLASGSAAFSAACNTTSPSTQHNIVSEANPATTRPASAATTPASGATTSRVVLVRTEDRVAGTQKAIDLLQPQGISGQTLFLKPNYNTADPAPAATDTPLLEALIQELQGAGAGQITIGDRSGMANTRESMQTKGVFQLADRYGLNAIVLDELDKEGWQYFPAEGTHWSQGFAFARPALQAGAIVNTCCLKTHRFGGHFTLSLKNTVGLVAKYVPGDPYNYMSELHSSLHQRLMIAEINKVYTPAMVLLDGVEAFVNGGPESGAIAKPGVILAGTDRVAVDVVAIGILRSLGTTAMVSQGSVWQLEQIRRAIELGLGVESDEQIEMVTADTASQTMADQIRQFIAA